MKKSEERTVSKKTVRVLKNCLDKLDKHAEDMTPIEFVSTIYKAADYYFKKDVAPLLVCKKGCSHCCNHRVEMTAMEANYIMHKTGITPKPIKSAQGVKLINEPCTFLKDNLCSIYEFRPLACRMFGTVDSAEFCKAGDVQHMIFTTESSPAVSIMNRSMYEASKSTDYAPCADIREWFPKAD